MAAVPSMKKFLEVSSKDFTKSLLPLYQGPLVTIRIGESGPELKVSRQLISKQSPYFAAMFKHSFKEGKDQLAELELVEGVVSVQSVEMLIQWFHLGQVVFDSNLKPQESISAAIKFCRFADMCVVTGMESLMAVHIKSILLANPDPSRACKIENKYTYAITTEHILSASSLPQGHRVRKILAEAAIEAYLSYVEHRFAKELGSIPSFATDILLVMPKTLKTMVPMKDGRVSYLSPLTGNKFQTRFT